MPHSRTAPRIPAHRPEPVPSASHSFDAGAAWAHLALQAHLWGLSTHAMGGFDPARAREKPSDRKPLEELVREGSFAP
jgi:nitroreductase